MAVGVVLPALSTSLTFLNFPTSPKFHGPSDKKPVLPYSLRKMRCPGTPSPSPYGLVETSGVDHTPAFRRTPVVTAVPSGLLTQQVYVPRSSSFTTRMVNSWKFFRVEEMRRWPLLSRRTPSVTRQSQLWISPGQPQHPAGPVIAACLYQSSAQTPGHLLTFAPGSLGSWLGQHLAGQCH